MYEHHFCGQLEITMKMDKLQFWWISETLLGRKCEVVPDNHHSILIWIMGHMGNYYIYPFISSNQI